MGRCAIILIGGLLAFTCGVLAPVSTRAQESTPVAETIGVEVAPGVTFDLVPALEDPPSLYRLRFAPGATLVFADDPAISLVYVETGALSLELDAAVSDARPEADSGDEENTNAVLALSQGDYLVLPPLVTGEIRNEAEEPAAIMIAAITPELIPATAIGTPVSE